MAFLDPNAGAPQPVDSLTSFLLNNIRQNPAHGAVNQGGMLPAHYGPYNQGPLPPLRQNALPIDTMAQHPVMQAVLNELHRRALTQAIATHLGTPHFGFGHF